MNKVALKQTKVSDCIIIDIPKIEDVRGKLAVVENGLLPFKMKRVYYLFDIPAGAYRGGHAHIKEQGFLIAMSGSFEVVLKDGFDEKKILLNRPDQGLLIPSGIWRELQGFSQGSIGVVVNSDEFDESDYIRDYQTFLRYKRQNQ